MIPPEEMHPDAGVVRATAQVSVLTALARIAGFARWLVLGYAVGTTYLGNVYQTANWIPNIMFELTAGGLLSAVLVPTFVAEMRAGRGRANEVASSLANGLLLVTIPLALAGILFGRPIMRLMLAGVPDPAVRAQQVEVGTWFLRFFLPQVPLYVLGMVMQGILHAHSRFLMPALAPLLSSLTVIATYLLFRSMGPGATLDTVRPEQLWVLAGGTTLGVFVLAFCQLPAVLRLGVRWRPVLGIGDPAVRRAVRAGGWGLAYFGVTQVGLLLILFLANRVEGGVVAFQIANALFELPNALIGLPVAISLFPSLAAAFHRSDEQRYAHLVSRGWRMAVLVAVPAAAGLLVLAPVLSEALLGWAEMADPRLVATTVRALAIGVPAWVLTSIVIRAFYARGRTGPPVAMNAAAMGTYAALALSLTFLADLSGREALGAIGLSFGVGHTVGVAVGVLLLARGVRSWKLGRDVRALGVSVVRALGVAAAAWAAARWTPGPPVVAASAGVAAGAVAFAVLASRSRDLAETWAAVRGRTA